MTVTDDGVKSVMELVGNATLKDIVAAQKDFLAKNFTGKLVLVPPKD